MEKANEAMFRDYYHFETRRKDGTTLMGYQKREEDDTVTGYWPEKEDTTIVMGHQKQEESTTIMRLGQANGSSGPRSVIEPAAHQWSSYQPREGGKLQKLKLEQQQQGHKQNDIVECFKPQTQQEQQARQQNDTVVGYQQVQQQEQQERDESVLCYQSQQGQQRQWQNERSEMSNDNDNGNDDDNDNCQRDDTNYEFGVFAYSNDIDNAANIAGGNDVENDDEKNARRRDDYDINSKRNIHAQNRDEILKMTTLDRNESHDAEPTSTAQMSAMNAKIDALQADVRFFGHQMMNLIAYLNVKPCHCESCKATEIRRQQRSQLTRYELTNERKRMNLAHLNNSQEGSSRMPDEAEKHVGHRRSSAGGSSPDDESDESPEEEEEEDEDHDDPMQDDTVSAGTIAASSSPPVDWTSSYATTVIAGPAAAAAAPLPPSPRRNDIQGSSLARRGRKSKYCSAAEKRAVADFAQKYGIGSAAHKFKIPHGVAAYYHRKQYKSAQSANSATVNEEKTFFPENFNGTEFIERNNNGGAQNDAAAVATATNDASGRTPLTVPIIGSSEETSTARNGGLNSAPPCGGGGSGGGGALLFERAPSPSDYGGAECGIYAPMDKCGAGGGAHSGSPGFLRGRGRGRPKLIGDELDAELVEFMVQLKSRKRQHLTASQALHIARNYIATKSPGLLEEHGGQIKLKITWAMKLVSRIAEREREIQLGLPAGSLQNNGRNFTMNSTAFNDGSNPNMAGAGLLSVAAAGSNGDATTHHTMAENDSAAAAQHRHQSQMVSLLSMLSKIGAVETSGAGAAAGDSLDIAAMLAEIGGVKGLGELAKMEPLRALLANNSAGGTQLTTELLTTSAF